MTRPVKRERVCHARVAKTAKASPGEWVRVGAYAAKYTAKTVASHISNGTGQWMAPAYTPPGAFEARLQDAEFDTEVYVRFAEGGVPR